MKIGLLSCGTLMIVSVAAVGCDTADEDAHSETAQAPDETPEFIHPGQCGTCHQRQYREWSGSMMRYGAISPTFNAFEKSVATLTGGHFAAGGVADNFCNGCHAPISVFNDEIPPFSALDQALTSRDYLGPVGVEGISCDFCHSVTGPDTHKSFLGDGIANVALEFMPSTIKQGPFDDAIDSRYHGKGVGNDFLRSSRFCGACHDVRPPVPDVSTEAPFLRLENLFTEWEASPYNTAEKRTTCQDCHMSLFPWEPPGTYPVGKAVSAWGADEPPPDRRVAPHYFTGVSTALIDYPGQDDPSLDGFGMPRGQKQRREAFLRAACTIDLHATPRTVAGDHLPVKIRIENVGAGHNVPAGFSQERQVWIELVVTDAEGVIVYRSGHLEDRPHPETGELEADGRLDDEDLQDEILEIDAETFEVTHHAAGPDADQRPYRNLGLINFQNRFLALDEHGELEQVHSAHLAQAIDNTRSLPPLQPRVLPYDIPLGDGLASPLTVSVRLRYRTFPPFFLRVLAQQHPDLVSEALIDRNTIVDMAEAEISVTLERDPDAAEGH